MNRFFLISIIYFLFSINMGFGQRDREEYPEINRAMPNFKLNGIHYYAKRNLKLSDFRGKHVILDFGHKYCTACFSSYPKIRDLLTGLSRGVKNNLQFILVLAQDKEDEIKLVYEKFRKKYGLQFAVTYDSLLYNRFVPAGAPHYIWINDKGIVTAITGFKDLTKDNIISFIKNRSFPYEDKSASAVKLILASAKKSVSPLLDSTVTFYSNIEVSQFLGFFVPTSISYSLREHKGVLINGVSLEMLYRFAYFNRSYIMIDDSLYTTTYHDPILNIHDSSLFSTKVQMRPRHYYNYILKLPDPSTLHESYVMEIMQDDLKKAFGYDVTIEKRKMPVLNLVATDRARRKLLTRGGEPKIKAIGGGIAGVGYFNQPIKSLIRALAVHYWYPRLPIIDKTGIKGNIDLAFNAIMTDKNDISRELRKHGLTVVQGEREMDVLVINNRPGE